MMQQEYFGNGEISRLQDLLIKLGSRKIFLVTGKKSYEMSGAKTEIEKLNRRHEIILFNNFSENPKIEDVEIGMEKLKNSECDTVIAIGGGSVIDMAKLTNIFSFQRDSLRNYVTGKSEIKVKGLNLIAVPTTSGAGSEATHFAVMYTGKEKHSIAHEFILPSIVIIDPELTYNLPSRQTAVSGMDALSQSVESYWSINSTEESKKFSSKAIKLIMENLKSAVLNPGKENRYAMSEAGNLAGKAINISKTTAPHALSYSMTSYFGIPHGQAVGISLSEFLKYNFDVSEKDINDKRGIEYVRKTIQEISEFMNCKNTEEAAGKINLLMKDIGLETRLSGLGIIGDDTIKIITENINLDRLNNNPRKLTKENLDIIIRNIL